ncbi:MAG: phage structural protein [Peptoanaerobacter stomatis]|uniref:phage structural protein n=1 Tax=Peptoanaerobacter stomatis TaxID=796937 RepID=UPI003FA139EA
MSDVITYDPLKVNLVIKGVAITGFADGTMIEIEKNEDAIMPYVGTQGEVSIAENADKTGTIKVTLQQTSPSVQYLNTLAKQKGDDAAFPISVINMNTNGVSASGTKARVKKMATETIDKEIKEREFEIFVADLDLI